MDTQEAARRHPEGPRRHPGTARGHPGDTRRYPGATQEAPGRSEGSKGKLCQNHYVFFCRKWRERAFHARAAKVTLTISVACAQKLVAILLRIVSSTTGALH